MASSEIQCDECGVYKEGVHCRAVKTICKECFDYVVKENKKLKKELEGEIERANYFGIKNAKQSIKIIKLEEKLKKELSKYKKRRLKNDNRNKT